MASRVLLGAANSPHVLLGAANSPFKMAGLQSDTVTFDLLDEIIAGSNVNLFDNLTEDEHSEVENVVTLLDTAKEDSLEQFEDVETNQQNARHKKVTETELHRLAAKNNAQSTSYQTKWAVVVMKDRYHSIFLSKLHET